MQILKVLLMPIFKVLFMQINIHVIRFILLCFHFYILLLIYNNTILCKIDTSNIKTPGFAYNCFEIGLGELVLIHYV